jgi:NAD+ kinase
VVGFKNIGILAHPLRPQTAPLAAQVAALFEARGIEAWYQTTWDVDSVQDLIPRADMMIAIGGDGAMLRAARVCAPHNVPLLGINMGALGFLTEIADPQDCETQIDQLLQGNYWIESRMMIRAHVLRAGAVVFTEDALNDVVISRGVVTRTVHLEAYIDHNWTTSYKADALIIATPTGSTAYALACGGPILPPELRNILIVPVAPHLSMDRPIVLSEGSVIEVAPAPDSSTEAVLTVDGRFIEQLQPGDHVVVEASTDVSRFARLRERNYFYRSLLDRLEPRVTAPLKPATHYPPEA